MVSVINLFFDWMPPILQTIVALLLAIFVVWSILKLVAAILDVIPFV